MESGATFPSFLKATLITTLGNLPTLGLSDFQLQLPIPICCANIFIFYKKSAEVIKSEHIDAQKK